MSITIVDPGLITNSKARPSFKSATSAPVARNDAFYIQTMRP
jgi:hypothetical protein